MSATKSPVSIFSASAGHGDQLDAAAAGDGDDRLRHVDERRPDAGADVVHRRVARCVLPQQHERRHHVVDEDVIAPLAAFAVDAERAIVQRQVNHPVDDAVVGPRRRLAGSEGIRDARDGGLQAEQAAVDAGGTARPSACGRRARTAGRLPTSRGPGRRPRGRTRAANRRRRGARLVLRAHRLESTRLPRPFTSRSASGSSTLRTAPERADRLKQHVRVANEPAHGVGVADIGVHNRMRRTKRGRPLPSVPAPIGRHDGHPRAGGRAAGATDSAPMKPRPPSTSAGVAIPARRHVLRATANRCR